MASTSLSHRWLREVEANLENIWHFIFMLVPSEFKNITDHASELNFWVITKPKLWLQKFTKK